MNPRLTSVPLHADLPRESGLSVDYFQPDDPFSHRWFHFLLGLCVGAGICAVIVFAVMVSK